MKVTRKRESLEKALKAPEGGEDGEIAPSLFIRGLPKAIDGLEGGKDFAAHIKGKCRGHSTEDRGGKEEHSYDLDVHHFEPHEGAPKEGKKKKSSLEQVEDAFKKYGPDAKKEDKKEEKKEAKK